MNPSIVLTDSVTLSSSCPEPTTSSHEEKGHFLNSCGERWDEMSLTGVPTEDNRVLANATRFRLNLPRMLEWYRSRDLEKVTLATHWFVSIDIRARMSQLTEDLREGNLEEVENAKETLASFSELGLKTVVALLDDPELHGIAKEILTEMDEHVLPHLLRWAERAESYNIRTGILQSLVGYLDDIRARKALADALRSPDQVEAALICRELLEAGPRGHQIIEIVFPEAQKEVA